MTGVALTSTRLASNHALRNGIHEILLKCSARRGIVAVWAVDQIQKREQERAANNILQLRARHADEQAPMIATQAQGAMHVETRDDLGLATAAAAPAGVFGSTSRTPSDCWFRYLMESALMCLVFTYWSGVGVLVSMGSYVFSSIFASFLRPCPEYKLLTSTTCRSLTNDISVYVAIAFLCPMHICGLIMWAVDRRCGSNQRVRVSMSMLLGWAVGCSAGLLLILPGVQRVQSDIVVWVRYRENIVVRLP